MARQINEIKKVITERFVSEPTVVNRYKLDTNKTFEEQFSKGHIESILFYCMSVGLWNVECMFDQFTGEIDKKIADLKPHSVKWYVNIIKKFQLGDELPFDSDVYEKIDVKKQIVKHCSVTEANGMLFIKVAKGDNDLTKLDGNELSALSSYIDRVRDAGVVYNLISRNADELDVTLTVHFDPLILNKNGKRIDGSSNSPVQDAIDKYLRNLPFNGEYSNMALVDSVRSVAGVKVVHLSSATAKYGSNSTKLIYDLYIPDAGYMRLKGANIIYRPHDY